MDVSTSEQLEILARLVIAGGLGAFIGLEREVRGYPAGIRTIALVAVGSCLFTDVSGMFAGDGGRISAQVVSGIGFLGAGLILREGGTVRGITTAATVWAAAAIGMAVGLSLYWVSVPGALFIVLILEARPVTKRVDAFLRRLAGELREPDDGEIEPPEEDPE